MNLVTCAPLTVTEQSRLSELESVIDRHIESFVQVAIALAEIKKSALYRSSHDNFSVYCEAKFGMQKTHGYAMAQAGEIIAHLSDTSEFPPTSYRQTKPLVHLQPDQQQQAWSAAVTVSGGKPTEARVNKAVEAISQGAPVRVGQSLTVHCGEFKGAVVTVIDVEGVVVQCETAAGEPVALLTSELVALEPNTRLNRSAKPGQTSELIEELETKLAIERMRTEMLESILRQCLPHLPAALKGTAESLL
jgi:hypothetical protein